MTDMIPNHADVSFSLLQDLWDGKFHAMNWGCMMPCSAQVLAAKGCKTEKFCANILRLRDSNTAWPKYCTQMPLHRGMLIYRDAFIHGCFYTEMLFTKTCFYTQTMTHTDALIRRCFYTQLHRRFHAAMLLHRGAQTRWCFYTQMPLHSNAFTQRSFYTHVFLHRKCFDTEHSLHREAFAQILLGGFFGAQMHLYRGVFETFWNTDNSQILLQRGVLHGYLYTEMLLHTGALRTRTLLGRGTFAWVRLDTRFTREGSGHFGLRLPPNLTRMFTRKSGFCKEMLVHISALTQGGAFAQRWFEKKDFTKGRFYSQALLHRDVFNTEMPLHTGALGGKYFYTETILQRESFRRRHIYTQVPLHRYAFTHSRFYALMGLRGAVTYKFFCVEIVLCASTFTQTYFDTHWQVFYTQILLHGAVFRIQVLSRTCRHACSFTGMSLNAHASTQRYFHTKILLRRDLRALRCFRAQR